MTPRAALIVLSSALLAPSAFAQAPGAPTTAPAGRNPVQSTDAWPQSITTNGATYHVYRPVLTGLDGSRAYFVTEVAKNGSDGALVMGEARLSADVMASDVPGEVEVNQFLVQSYVVDGKPAPAADVTALGQALYFTALTSDRATMVRSLQLVNPRASSTPGLRHLPPNIVVTQTPSVLVQVDGEPRLAAVGSSGWMRVTNTPAILLKSPDGQWCARVSNAWQRSSSLDAGFAPGEAPPADVVQAIGKAPPPPSAISSTTRRGSAPTPVAAGVVVATEPTVLVSMNGALTLADAAPGVQQVTNTPSILLTTDGSTFYLLSAGRWFSTPDLAAGSWSAVAPGDLPPAFAQLPSTPRMDAVRAAVPGTPESNEAVLASREIRTVTLRRTGATPDLKVNGAPEWTPISGTDMSWLVNATQPVIRSGGLVYACDAGAWFQSDSEQGPWALADRVPDEVYSIPASCPIYPCTYVWVMGSTTDSVTYGFSPGYLGTYLHDGTPVYGTGYAYPQASAESYDPYPQTYGFDPSYDAPTGTFAPPAPAEGVPYYGYADLWPEYMSDCGWGGWGWCCGWNQAWGWGWGGWWGWNHWGWWMNHWHPYYDRWNQQHHEWQRAHAAAANQRLAQHGMAPEARNWPTGRGAVADGARNVTTRRADASIPRRDGMAAARENQDALQRRYDGAASDAPAAFRGPGNEYGGYSPVAYRPWTGMGSPLGGNWGYEPLARPNGFHPPQQFIAPGAYWGAGRNANVGPYSTPPGANDHGGWGTYDHWAGEGIRGTQWGERGGARGGRR